MRILAVFLGIMLSNVLLFGQAVQSNMDVISVKVVPDIRIENAYGAAHTAQILASNPQVIEKLNFYLDHGWIISDFPAEKGDISTLRVVQLPSLEQINILAIEAQQNLTKDWKKWSFYRINDTNKVLVLFSTEEVNRRFRRWKKTKS